MLVICPLIILNGKFKSHKVKLKAVLIRFHQKKFVAINAKCCLQEENEEYEQALQHYELALGPAITSLKCKCRL